MLVFFSLFAVSLISSPTGDRHRGTTKITQNTHYNISKTNHTIKKNIKQPKKKKNKQKHKNPKKNPKNKKKNKKKKKKVVFGDSLRPKEKKK